MKAPSNVHPGPTLAPITQPDTPPIPTTLPPSPPSPPPTCLAPPPPPLVVQVKYKAVMKEYQLGPNGGILTSCNLFATRFDQASDAAGWLALA